MNSRSMLMVNLLQTAIASSVTSTASGSTVDLANYFPVGKREIKFVLGVLFSTTTTGFTASVTVQESDSTTTTSRTNVTSAFNGSTVTLTSGDGLQTMTEFHGFVTKRYLNVLYNGGQATTGGPTLGVFAIAFPFVRAA